MVSSMVQPTPEPRRETEEAGLAAGVLILAGTPIGDTRYVSQALGDALINADIIAAEDTRKFADLCRRAELKVTARVISFFEGNEASRSGDLVEQMVAGARVVLVTDAGMPSVSDPGFRLVSQCIDAGVRVSVVPGPSAVLAALAVSGLSTDRFCFEGFLPRKSSARRTRLTRLRTEERTLIFFEAPHRLHDFLVDAAEVFGEDRSAAICRELTKTHEEVIRGPVSELVAWAEGEVRGEITIVVSGASPSAPEIGVLVEVVVDLIASGEKRSAAVGQVASMHHVDRRVLYDAVLAARRSSN